jgi:hypothetical protein
MLGFEGNWKKGFFPHKFNTPENQTYVGSIPDESFYEPSQMSESRLQSFHKWYHYEKHIVGQQWNFQENLLLYCKADVLILSKALEMYDTLMKELNNEISPLTNVTLASYALTVYRNLYMPSQSIYVATEEEHRFAQASLHGGRTDVRVMFKEWCSAQVAEGYYGCYVDVQSMYPFVQYTCGMPSGVPSWRNFAEHESVDLQFLKLFIGFAECDIEPTCYLHHPIVGGLGSNGKYVFDLLPKKKIILTSIEIQKAISHGYKVTRIYRALCYEERTDLFKTYVEKFLKIKLESSGMPKNIDWETFQEEHEQKLGIRLEQDKMLKNTGLRVMSKLLLNSLWGKLGQDPNLRHSILIEDSETYAKIMDLEYVGKIEVNQMQPLSAEKTFVQFTKSELDGDFDNKNVAVASFVAAGGRLHLWETLDFLGERVLYHDTDSVIYEHNPVSPSVNIGYMLGDWENELEFDDVITSFVALGPKTYSYKTLKGTSSIKCKGFTLNSANRQTVTHEKFIRLLLGSRDGAHPEMLSNRIFKWARASGQYWTSLQTKLLRFTADKNEINWSNYSTKPFGYRTFV